MKYKNIREEELKNKVAADWFRDFDTTEIIGNIDFTVYPKQHNLFGRNPLLWAEAKTGDYDIPAMFVQLILTIGKARTFDKTLPPPFLGAFDYRKMAFIDYVNVQDIFYLNDFNWNVAPSNHNTKEFKLIKDRVEGILKEKTYVFDYERDEKELRSFIKNNIAKATTKSKIKIDKNNFISIYLRWLEVVKPIINTDWEELKKRNILDSDFYLADLFVDDKNTQNIDDDTSVKDNLFVVFQNQEYKIAKENLGLAFDAAITIKNKKIYTDFWKIYKRPPVEEFQDYIIERRDLLVPQDIRERKGAFFTPRIWVELSQKYLTDTLGENWQDEYYIWDCAAGTGNLLAGLTNKYNIYASTIDRADINVMHERIDHGANLLKSHVFQFDFLNDEFKPVSQGGKIPDSLFEIIQDPEKRKKLVIYINPPYAEATTAKTVTGTGKNKAGVTTNFKIKQKLNPVIGNASNEFFALFMAVIYEQLNGAVLAQFSTLKFVNGSNFRKFRNFFLAEYLGGFVVPAYTFDNVRGKFPIGFTVWNTAVKQTIQVVTTDVYDQNGNYSGVKRFYGNILRSINNWISNYQNNKDNSIGTLFYRGNDFQNQKYIYIGMGSTAAHDSELYLSEKNIIPTAIYFSVRHSIKATWLNDRDQFLWPDDGWQNDTEFQNDCLAYTLFHSQNKISCKNGINHWIPFTEREVNAQERFESHFMTDFILGKHRPENNAELFSAQNRQPAPLTFSPEAQAVFEAGKKLWQYYHSQPGVNVNAGLYDIREYFQGRNEKGRMNAGSDDQIYMALIGDLRSKLGLLADKIKPKVYAYGFLKE